MTRILTFGPCKDESGAKTGEDQRFALFVNLFVGGGNLLHFNPQSGPTSRSREDGAKEAKVVRAWKAISTEVDGGRSLNESGGTIILDQKSHELVMKYLVAAPRGTGEADVVDDLIDWVSAAPSE